jgi:hypothetical protein
LKAQSSKLKGKDEKEGSKLKAQRIKIYGPIN